MNEFTLEGKVKASKLLKNAIKTEKGTYQIIVDLIEGEISLVIEVAKDLNSIKTIVMDYELIDVYAPFYNQNSTGQFVIAVRNAYNEAMNNFLTEYVIQPQEENQTYLVPDQIASKYIELNKLTRLLHSQKAVYESEVDSKETKYGNQQDILLNQDVDNSNIVATNDRINALIAEIDRSSLPMPQGRTISYGSYVTFRKANIAKEFKVLIIQGDIDRSLSYNSEIKFASTSSPIGEAVFGHEANEAVTVSGSQNIIYIVEVDNEFVYRNYSDSYTNPDYKETISQIYSKPIEQPSKKI